VVSLRSADQPTMLLVQQQEAKYEDDERQEEYVDALQQVVLNGQIEYGGVVAQRPRLETCAHPAEVEEQRSSECDR
jgi:hypothetical protein